MKQTNWIEYRNVSDLDFSKLEKCRYCSQSEFKHLQKRGTLLDFDLGFLSYISFEGGFKKEVIVGSHPNNSSEVMYCKNCKRNYLKYYIESGFAGKYEHKELHADNSFSTELASCSMTLDEKEVEFLIRELQIGNFENYYQKEKFFNLSNNIDKIKVLNVSKHGELTSLNLAGQRNEIHRIVKSINGINSRGKHRQTIILKKKFRSALRKLIFEESNNIDKKVLKIIDNGISETIRLLANREHLLDKDSVKEEINLMKSMVEDENQEIVKLIEKIKSCSEQRLKCS